MSQRGATLIELLVATVVGGVIFLGLTGFYSWVVRVGQESSAQTYLQRQAALAIEELNRQIRPATGLTRGACNGDPNSIGVTNSSGVYCFYGASNRFLEGRQPASGGSGTRDLLAGSLGRAPLAVNSFTSSLTATTVTVTFQLHYSDATSDPMTFTTTIARRN